MMSLANKAFAIRRDVWIGAASAFPSPSHRCSCARWSFDVAYYSRHVHGRDRNVTLKYSFSMFPTSA